MFRKLQPKLIVLMAPLIVLPLLFLGGIAFSQLKKTTEEKALSQMTTLLQQVSLQFEEKIRIAQANAVLFSNSMLMQKYITSSERDRYSLMQSTLLRQLDSYQKAYPEYRNISIVLPDGYVDTSLHPMLNGEDTDDVSGIGYFQALSAGQHELHTQFLFTAEQKIPSLLVSKRMALIERSTDPIVAEPRVRGYLLIDVGLAFLQEQINNNPVGEGGFLFATDGRGNVVIQPKHVPFQSNLAQEYIRKASNSFARPVVQYVVLDQVEYILEGYAIADNFKLFALLPRDELLASSYRMGVAVAGITLVAILLTIGLVFLSVKQHLISPIQKLAIAARRIGQGDLEVEIQRQSQDELGDLAEAFRDMRNDLRKSHEQVRFLAYHDSVTGLPNRLMFREYLQDVLSEAERNGRQAALLFLDLDNFKRVNDTLGHHAGDELLKELARRLGACVRGNDLVGQNLPECAPELVARLGGDEFIILLPGISDEDECAGVAERILDALDEPVILQSHEIRPSASIGITLYPRDGKDVSTLIKNADIAMYHAKSQGKKNYQYYSEKLDAGVARLIKMEARLRRAIEQGELLLEYQPVLDAKNLQVIGAEALVRWNDPQLGMVYPDVFIGLAEETGLIVPLGEWVLREACRQCSEWHRQGLDHLVMAVNLSAVQIRQSDILTTVTEVLEETGLPAHCLELELTETSILAMGDTASATFDGMNQLGVALALDDFGTGYSSLVYLRGFSFDRLKIDRSFVRDIETDDDDAAICSAIIAMANKLGMKVTAEGVETDPQRIALNHWGCDHFQGYLFCKPVSSERFITYVKQHLRPTAEAIA